MSKCHVCGNPDLTRTCNHCGHAVCTAHTLPENHECDSLLVTVKRREKQTATQGSTIGGKQTVNGLGANYRHKGGSDASPDLNSDGSLADKQTKSFTTEYKPDSLPLLERFLIQLRNNLSAILLIMLLGGGVVAIGGIGPFLDAGGDIVDDGGGIVAESLNDTDMDGVAPDETYEQSEQSAADIDATAVEFYIHEYVNAERTEQGLSNISYDGELANIAEGHSIHMASNGFFSHTAPNGSNPDDRYTRYGYNCRINLGGGEYVTGGSENIAQTWYNVRIDTGGSGKMYTSERELARGIVTQWMNSPGHRENILRRFWQNEGIGVSITTDSGKTKVYATQNFC